MWPLWKFLIYPLTKWEKSFKAQIELDKAPSAMIARTLLWELEQNTAGHEAPM